MKEKLLITGGSGFVAYHIIQEALKQKYQVYVSVRQSSNISHLQHLNLQSLVLDFGNIAAIKKQLNQIGITYIIHAAGATTAMHQQEYDLVNATYTYNLAKAAAEMDIPLKKFVFVSSLAAVGPALNGQNITENAVPAPVTSYGRSKLKAEQLLSKITGICTVSIRPTAVYGPRDKDILIILKTFGKGLEPYIGNRPQLLSFVYVKDLARLLVDILPFDCPAKAYNISDGNLYERYQMATITKKILLKKTIKIHLPIPVVQGLAYILEKMGKITGKTPILNREKINELTASWVCNAEAAKNDLNYTATYNLETGLKETLDWYRKENWL